MNISVFFMTLCKLVIYPVIIISKLNAACGIPNEYIHLYARQGSPLRREMIPEFIRAGTAGFGPTRLNKPLLQPIPCRCPSRYPDGVTGSTRIDLECDDAQTEESPWTAAGTASLTRQFPAGWLYTRTVTPSRHSWRSGPEYLILPETPDCLTRKFARPGPCSSRPHACFRVRPFTTDSIFSSRPPACDRSVTAHTSCYLTRRARSREGCNVPFLSLFASFATSRESFGAWGHEGLTRATGKPRSAQNNHRARDTVPYPEKSLTKTARNKKIGLVS